MSKKSDILFSNYAGLMLVIGWFTTFEWSLFLTCLVAVGHYIFWLSTTRHEEGLNKQLHNILYRFTLLAFPLTDEEKKQIEEKKKKEKKRYFAIRHKGRLNKWGY